MSVIKFENIIIKPGYIRADYQDNNTSHFIEFELSQDIVVRDDLIATTLATLCGYKYKKIYMELSISEEVKKAIEYALRTEVFCKSREIEQSVKKPFKNHIVSFSGGFDSLSMLPFLPESSGLVAMDFGGSFSREMEIIRSFTDFIVKTNILDTDFRSNSWTFMLIASILYSDLMSAKYNVWGGVFAGSVISNIGSIDRYATPYVIRGTGMRSVPYLLSITEVGTAKILLKSYPELIDDSLQSLAAESSEKRYRKQMYIEIESMRNNVSVGLPNKLDTPLKPFAEWGKRVHSDFMQLYLIKHLGYTEASTIIKDIPEQANDLGNNLKLDFFDRFNPNVLKHIPSQFKEKYVSTLLSHGIEPYTENDWKELHQVREFLAKWHTIK